MSDTSNSTEAGNRYIAEYLDGPFAGTTEHRYLIDGAPEPSVVQIALVEGTEGQYEYLAGQTDEKNGMPYVQFSLDQRDSDALEGAADQDAESKRL